MPTEQWVNAAGWHSEPPTHEDKTKLKNWVKWPVKCLFFYNLIPFFPLSLLVCDCCVKSIKRPLHFPISDSSNCAAKNAAYSSESYSLSPFYNQMWTCFLPPGLQSSQSFQPSYHSLGRQGLLLWHLKSHLCSWQSVSKTSLQTSFPGFLYPTRIFMLNWTQRCSYTFLLLIWSFQTFIPKCVLVLLVKRNM